MKNDDFIVLIGLLGFVAMLFHFFITGKLL